MKSMEFVDQNLSAKLDELASRLQFLGQDVVPLAEVRDLVEQLQTERDQLRQQVKELESERDRLRTEHKMLLHAWADLRFSEEELERREQEPGGCSLAEIWQRLEQA